MQWFARDFDREEYFDIYRDKEEDAAEEGPALAGYLGLRAGALVLDLPCGWGRLQPHLLAQGYTVMGGDLSRLNLRRHAQEHPAPIVGLDLRTLPFRDSCAEGVLCAYTSWGYFRTLEENRAQIREFARVLRPGGALLLDLAGREYTAQAIALVEGIWFEVEFDGVHYSERARWSRDKRRVITERTCRGAKFRHDIWLPTDAEVRQTLAGAGLNLDQAWGGFAEEPLEPESERWIYRAVKPG